VPSPVTRMFAGLMSRWTTRFWWAYWTARQTVRKRAMRSRTPRPCASLPGAPAVEEARDVRVLEPREDLALLPEAPDGVRVHPLADDLDRHALPELFVGARGEEDRSHPSPAEFTENPVRADPRGRRIGRDGLLGRRLEKARALLGRPEERRDLGAQLLVVAAGPGEKRRPDLLRPLERVVEDALDLLPALRRHRCPRVSSRWSQAFAAAQSRLTVFSETPSAAAVSTTSRPAKKRISTTRA